MSDSPPTLPPWERGLWRRVHLWGARNPKWYYVTPASVWAVFIYVTCLMDLRAVESAITLPPIPHLDKLVHGVYYAILGALLVRGWQREKMPPLGLHVLVFTLCVVFGTMIEVQQLTTGYRSFELGDIAADAVGALVGQALWHLLMVRWGKRTRLYPGLLRPKLK